MTTEVGSPFASENEVIFRTGGPFRIRVGYLERLYVKIVSPMTKDFSSIYLIAEVIILYIFLSCNPKAGLGFPKWFSR